MQQKKGKTVEEVYKEIKKMIYYNMLAPGQKLYYQDLAKRLSISTTPVIQALKRLERSNLVRHEPNKGYFVGEINETEARELFQAREALETYAISLLIQNLSGKNMDSIGKAFEEYNKATSPEYKRIRMLKDAQFHLSIVDCAGNKLIYNLLKEIFEQIYLRYKPEYLWGERIKEAAIEHRAIIKSLEKGNVKEITGLIKTHIRNGLAHIIRYLHTDDYISIE